MHRSKHIFNPFSHRKARYGRLWFYVLGILFAVLLSACTQDYSSVTISSGENGSPFVQQTTNQKEYQVAESLQPLYEALGGEPILGPIISDTFYENKLECQYSMNALLCADPLIDEVSKFSLAPLAAKQNISDDPLSAESPENAKVVDGYLIYDAFVPLFDTLYGTRFTGKPISQPRYNNERRRTEQYFANIAMAHDDDTPPGEAYLMPLGYADCGAPCSFASPEVPSSGIDLSPTTAQAATPTQADGVPQDSYSPFPDFIQEVNGIDYFGDPITKAFETSDGYLMQIFENVVLYAPLNTPADVSLYPVAPVWADVYIAPPGKPQYGASDGMTFYFVDESAGEGYHVPLIFDEFIRQHGGQMTSGNPLAEIVQYQDGALRQCFENYCLDYLPQAPPVKQVKAYPLGKAYLDTGIQEGTISPDNLLNAFVTPEATQLLVAEEKPQVTPDEPINIIIFILRNDMTTPVSGVSATVVVSMPDGSEQIFQSAPTGAEGFVSVIVPPIESLDGGSNLIEYKVCLDLPGDPVCKSDSVLVWSGAP